MANVDAPYNYQKAILRSIAAKNAGAAAPSIEEVTAEHAAAAARTDAADADLSRDVAYAEKALALKGREADAKFDLDRQMLETWGEQNKWATSIAIANLGISALAIPASLRTAEKQENHQKRLATIAESHVAALEEANRIEARRQKDFDDQQGYKKYNVTLDPAPVIASTTPWEISPGATPGVGLPALTSAQTRRQGASGLPLLYRH